MTTVRQVASVLACGVMLVGCDNQSTEPGGLSLSGHDLEASAVKSGEAGASVRWNAIERDLLIKHSFADQNAALRQFAYLSLAQYNAVIAAENGDDGDERDDGDDGQVGGTHPSKQGAVAGASAAVLTYFYPDEQAFLDGQVNAQGDGEQSDGEEEEEEEAHTNFGAGVALGRLVGAQVIASAATDRFGAPFTGTIPVCPGCWHSNAPGLAPVHPEQGQERPFFLTSGSQFRPAAPPAFGSPEYLAALAEIRRISDTRTREQDSIAKFWAPGPGTSLVAGLWNSVATDLIVQFRQHERKAAHTLALMNMAALDALIASHEAKYYYWLIRPTQADPLITLSIGLPNHPSYPSNHAAVSTTTALILGRIFPSQASRLAAMADEAGLSRLYGGIHYRFDKTAGEAIARNVSALALRLDVRRHEAFALKP